jgi:hypothetical protein
MTKIKLKLFDYCASVPSKCLALMPSMVTWLYNKKYGRPNPTKGGVYAIEGSRGSSKSQSFMRIVGELLEAGYADAITIGIITESALDESVVSLFDEIFENQIDERFSKNHYRKLKSGQEIFFKGFHPSKKTALKGTERATDILLIDEVEGWKENAAAMTLNTYIRAGGIILLLSNRFDEDVKIWVKSVGGTYMRIDYWENPHLDSRTRETWDTMRETDPELWKATILYQGDNDDYIRLFNNITIDRMLDENTPPVGTPLVKALSQDFAIGGKDFNVRVAGIKDNNGLYHLYVHKGDTYSTEKLLTAIMKEKQEFMPDIFIGDSVGQGLPLMQMIGVESPTNIYFNGGREPHLEGYFNLRASAFGRVKELADKHLIAIHCDPTVQSRIREDAKSIILASEDNKGNIKILPKERIRKILGRSPDYMDAISMCIYALDSGGIYADTNTPSGSRIGSYENSWDW